MKYILFGAGYYGKLALDFLGKKDVLCFWDNDESKEGTYIEGVPVQLFKKGVCLPNNIHVVISIAPDKEELIKKQLNDYGYHNVSRYSELKYNIIKERIQSRTDYLGVYRKAVGWIKRNTIDNSSIICTTELKKGYPEVTGYYIPSLMRWGYRELAVSYAKWLCDIQKEDGSWYDTEDNAPYIFDSAQVLKGLLAVREILPMVDKHIIKGCDWIISCMDDEGRLITPCKDAWGVDTDTCDEVIHIYCLSPLIEAAQVFMKPEYEEKARKIFKYYKDNYYEKIMNFSLLSHFYAYLMEALLDIGEVDMVRDAMLNLEMYQKENGAVPAYNSVDWVCSTGLFQLAIVWFRLGNLERGNKTFQYACKLQNNSGGWYGSYLSEDNLEEINSYIPNAEISWAVKYFLDALYYKMVCEFDYCSDFFVPGISEDDGRYKIVEKELLELFSKVDYSNNISILDVGCGKGRYLNLLKKRMSDAPKEISFHAVDLSLKVMRVVLNDTVDKRMGTLTNIPYDDGIFDYVYTCETLEHAVDIENAIKEMVRVTKKHGKILVLDKNIDAYGKLEISEWEQWFDDDKLSEIMKRFCSDVYIYKNIDYENVGADGLFHAWVGIVE